MWLTRLTSSGSSDSAFKGRWYSNNNSYGWCGSPGSPAPAHLTQPSRKGNYQTTIVTEGVAHQAHQLWLIWLSLQGKQCCGSMIFWCRFRIRIRGSMPMTNGSGSWSCYFLLWPSRCQQKTNLKKVFCILLFEGHLHNFLKIKGQKEVTKQ